MRSRRDQVQAHSFVLGRLACALVSGEPDTPENPHRRTVVGAIVSLLVAALVAGGFGVYGLIRPGGATSWRAPGVLITEKETGSRYVLLDGQLRPVLNFASALLLFQQRPSIVSVSSRSLVGVPHGPAIGVVGAPDALPASGAVVGAVWSACAQTANDQAGNVSTATTLAVTREAGEPPAPLPRAIVVRVADGPLFLVWQGRRFRFADDRMARVLGYDAPTLTVETRWADLLPPGPDIAPAAIPGHGEPGPTIDGRVARIGELFTAPAGSGPARTFILLRDGLSQLSPVAEAIVAGDPRTADLYRGGPVEPARLSPAALGQVARSASRVVAEGLPEESPALADSPAGTAWCVRQGGGTGELTVGPAPRLTASAATFVGGGVTRSTATASAVVVAPGVGGLVRAADQGQAQSTNLYLVADNGVKFPVADAEAARRLGQSADQATSVPRSLLELLPTGPLLRAP
ncbi:type VII secretion protein EccB [Micromonospora sp. NPDC093277]|uniref:type VII secretion protein EccB n=1 Tax=Micromonospora sp. NPDC093277 TaxID=3364291 RepID=UPI0038244B29